MQLLDFLCLPSTIVTFCCGAWTSLLVNELAHRLARFAVRRHFKSMGPGQSRDHSSS